MRKSPETLPYAPFLDAGGIERPGPRGRRDDRDRAAPIPAPGARCPALHVGPTGRWRGSAGRDGTRDRQENRDRCAHPAAVPGRTALAVLMLAHTRELIERCKSPVHGLARRAARHQFRRARPRESDFPIVLARIKPATNSGDAGPRNVTLSTKRTACRVTATGCTAPVRAIAAFAPTMRIAGFTATLTDWIPVGWINGRAGCRSRDLLVRACRGRAGPVARAADSEGDAGRDQRQRRSPARWRIRRREARATQPIRTLSSKPQRMRLWRGAPVAAGGWCFPPASGIPACP